MTRDRTLTAHCTVWWAGLHLDSPARDALLTLEDRERTGRFRDPADRSRARLATALIRTAAARHTGLAPVDVPIDRTCPDCGRPHGKPAIVGSDLQVSVAHSGDWVVLATSLDAAVGVDVETLDQAEPDPSLLDLALTDAERADFTRADDRTAWFLQLWTRKEAVVKATGDGLRVLLREIDVHGPVLTLDAPTGHVAALAARATTIEVTTVPADELL